MGKLIITNPVRSLSHLFYPTCICNRSTELLTYREKNLIITENISKTPTFAKSKLPKMIEPGIPNYFFVSYSQKLTVQRHLMKLKL